MHPTLKRNLTIAAIASLAFTTGLWWVVGGNYFLMLAGWFVGLMLACVLELVRRS